MSVFIMLLSVSNRAVETVEIIASETDSLNLAIAAWSVALGSV